ASRAWSVPGEAGDVAFSDMDAGNAGEGKVEELPALSVDVAAAGGSGTEAGSAAGASTSGPLAGLASDRVTGGTGDCAEASGTAARANRQARPASPLRKDFPANFPG
ncbi:MAG TPA: hypothetical protein PLH06_13250, partial [Candidatus Hydrogenedentes bacterium]|nr:hypothetical protein [Candidatus Hydrogenedentota bacterium]